MPWPWMPPASAGLRPRRGPRLGTRHPLEPRPLALTSSLGSSPASAVRKTCNRAADGLPKELHQGPPTPTRGPSTAYTWHADALPQARPRPDHGQLMPFSARTRGLAPELPKAHPLFTHGFPTPCSWPSHDLPMTWRPPTHGLSLACQRLTKHINMACPWLAAAYPWPANGPSTRIAKGTWPCQGLPKGYRGMPKRQLMLAHGRPWPIT